ncbi:hypothetical protein [Nocardioides speluncae]|uniref:hypothetical protein n=1 Tax=Nocardioides speluncae TaxID=2670337 RepID=UPI000D68F730|nr:hypothetical protein [Nocardioides speluncae]
MTTPHDLEDQVRNRFERTMSDTTAPVDAFRTGAVARGRRLRRRRRTLITVSAITAIAVTGLGIQQASGGSTARESTDYAGNGLPDVKQAATPSVSWWDLPASEMVARLEPLLSTGVRIVDPLIREPGATEENFGFLISGITSPTSGGTGGFNMIFYSPEQPDEAVRDDGNDPGDSMTIMAEGPRYEQQVDCTWLLSQNKTGATCDQLTGPGGERAILMEDAYDGIELIEFRMLRTDGSMMYVSTSNSSQDKWNEPTSYALALTPAQVRAIGESDVWYD